MGSVEVFINNGVLTFEPQLDELGELLEFFVFWNPTEGDEDHLHFFGSLKNMQEVNSFIDQWKLLDVSRK